MNNSGKVREYVALADELLAQNYGNVADVEKMGPHFDLLARAADALRTAAKSGSDRAGVDALREQSLRSALETAAARFNMMAGVGLVNGADPKIGYREAMAALATPPAQPAPASGDEVERLRDALSLALQYLPAQPTDSDAQKDIARIHDLIAGKTVAWNEMHVSESPSTHGKPDGAVREALDDIQSHHNSWRQIMEDMRDHQSRCREPDDEKYIQHEIDVLDRVAAALQSKITAAETSPGDVVAMKEASIAARDLLRRLLKEKKLGIQYAAANQICWQLSAAVDRLDVKAEAKSQEPVAVAVAWRRRRKGIVGNGGWIMCPEYPGCDREFDLEPLFTHPTTKQAQFDKWFESNFFDPDGGSDHLPDGFKDDLRYAWNSAIAALIDGER